MKDQPAICKYVAAKVEYLNIVQILAEIFAPIDRRNAKNEGGLLVAAAEGNEKILSVFKNRERELE